MTDNLALTPFNALKTAEQNTQFAIDPSEGLTRERYHWFSNNTLFDSTFFSNGEGEIDITTGTSGTDTAVLQSALAGQYISQSLAKPGAKFYLDPSNVELDENNHVSLNHGRFVVGPFIINSSGTLTDGFGLEVTTDGARAIWMKDGSHQGESPVPQGEWTSSQLDAKGEVTATYDPSNGYVLNFPYTWYNNGALTLALLDAQKQRLQKFHEFVPPSESDGRASLTTPNLPVTVLMDNDGDAQPMTGAVGGIQYTTYGSADGVERRDTYMSEQDVSIGTEANSPLDPIAEPGEPIYAIRRAQNDGVARETVNIRLQNISVEPDGDIFIYVWDEYNPETALTGTNFRPPFSNYDSETRVEVDTDATEFDNTNSIFRKIIAITSTGNKNKVELSEEDVEERVPLRATRIVTIVGQSSSNVTLSYIMKNIEGF